MLIWISNRKFKHRTSPTIFFLLHADLQCHSPNFPGIHTLLLDYTKKITSGLVCQTLTLQWPIHKSWELNKQIGSNHHQKSAFHITVSEVPQDFPLLRKWNAISGMVVQGRDMLSEALLCVAGPLDSARDLFVLRKQTFRFEWSQQPWWNQQ